MRNKGNIYLSNDKWKLKSKGTLVYIENSSKNKILAVGDDDNVNEEVLVRNDTKQLWNKGVANSEGYFTLTNSHKVLTAVSVNGIKVKDSDDSVKVKSFVENDATQMWEKGEGDDEGYFTLINSHSKKVLTAISEHRLEMKGKVEL